MGDTKTLLSCRIDLPSDFRAGDVLAFHRRDSGRVAERVDDTRLCKGLLWQGTPALLQIHIGSGTADASLQIDWQKCGPRTATRSADPIGLEKMVSHMLGLRQAIEPFERLYRNHPQLGALIRRNRGLRVPQAASPFEAASWAIIGQQISVRAAVSVRRRLILSTGVAHSSGLWCYPDAQRVLEKGEPVLRAAGLSSGKAGALQALSRGIVSGELPLEDWSQTPEPDAIRAALLGIRGIGPWTVDYTLLRGFNELDGSLHGDVAVRRNLQMLLGRDEPVSEREAGLWLKAFRPWRALVAAHLWASAGVVA